MCAVVLAVVQSGYAADIVSHISIKQPGNRAVTYELKEQGNKLVADAALPLTISKSVSNVDGEEVVTLTFTATGTTYFNFGAELNTGYTTDDCEFYMPGFWYHRNLRSPKEAPSFHTSKAGISAKTVCRRRSREHTIRRQARAQRCSVRWKTAATRSPLPVRAR